MSSLLTPRGGGRGGGGGGGGGTLACSKLNALYKWALKEHPKTGGACSEPHARAHLCSNCFASHQQYNHGCRWSKLAHGTWQQQDCTWRCTCSHAKGSSRRICVNRQQSLMLAWMCNEGSIAIGPQEVVQPLHPLRSCVTRGQAAPWMVMIAILICLRPWSDTSIRLRTTCTLSLLCFSTCQPCLLDI